MSTAPHPPACTPPPAGDNPAAAPHSPVTADCPTPADQVLPGAVGYRAAPLDQVIAWVNQWGTSLQVLGVAILAICCVLVGIKLAAKSVGGTTTGGGGTREAIGSMVGLVMGGILIGAALIIAPIVIGAGTGSGAP